jgi:hypothetical protein
MKKISVVCISLLFAPVASGQSNQPPVPHPPVAGFGKKADVPPVAVTDAMMNGKITETNPTLNNLTVLDANGKSVRLQVRSQSYISVNSKNIAKFQELKKGDVCAIKVSDGIIERADCKRP